MAYTALTGSGLLTLPLLFVWRSPDSFREMAILANIALLAAVGKVLVIKALEAAQAVVVAPVQYTLMIWGAVYDYLIFGQSPDSWTWAGTAIIIGTGLYTFRPERVTG